MRLQLNPIPPLAQGPGPARSAAIWPRLYARHLAHGDIFELARGPAAHACSETAHTFGPAWHVWREHHRRPGHRDPSARHGLHITPGHSTPADKGAASL